MVLSAPAADDRAARVPAWLTKLVAQLELARRGVLLALTRATPTQLGTVVRALSEAPPWAQVADGEALEVCLDAPKLAELPLNSRVLLRVRVEDLDWLNVNRPVFGERALRAVLWLDEAAHRGLSRRAVDVYDWVSRIVEVPARAVPEFTVMGLRTALELGVGVAWTGVDLQQALAAIGWPEGVIELDAADGHAQLLAGLIGPGLPVVSGVCSERDAWRVRMALAEAGRSGTWVAKQPAIELPGMLVVHDRQADWDWAATQLVGQRRPELLAAWFELEPERIEAARAGVAEGPSEAKFDAMALASASAPTWAVRSSATTLLRTAREQIVALPDPPEDRAMLVAWADGSEPWQTGATGAIEARMVRALRELDMGEPAKELVDASQAGGFVEVALELALCRARGATSSAPQRDDDRFMHVVELAQELVDVGRYEVAEHALRECITIAEQAHGTREHADVLAALRGLAAVLWIEGHYDEAERSYRTSIEIGAKVHATRQHPLIAGSLQGLANVLWMQGKLEEAEQTYREAIAVAQRASGTNPPLLAASWSGLGMVLARQGRYEEAAESYRAAIHAGMDSDATADESMATAWQGLADVLARQGLYGAAEQAYRDSLVAAQRAYGTKQHPFMATSLFGLANVLSSEGKYEEAVQTHRTGVDVARRMYGDAHPSTGRSLVGLARTLEPLGRYEEAEQAYREGIMVLEHAYGTTEHFEVAAALGGLARLLARRGDFDEAIRLFGESTSILERAFGSREHPAIATVLHDLASVLEQQGKYDEAERSYREVIAIEAKLFNSSTSAATLPTIRRLAALLLRRGRFEEARELASEIWGVVLQRDAPVEVVGVAPIYMLSSVACGRIADARRAQGELLTALQQLPENHPERIEATAELSRISGLLGTGP